jgi:hypothetical protein
VSAPTAELGRATMGVGWAESAIWAQAQEYPILFLFSFCFIFFEFPSLDSNLLFEFTIGLQVAQVICTEN